MGRGILILGVLAAWACSAASPVLTSLQPWGAQRGKAFTLAIYGSGLAEGARIVSPLPAIFTPLAEPEGPMGPRRIPYLVELRADAPLGAYPVRVETPGGLSNILLFTVGAFAEIQEEESEPGARPNANDSLKTAQAVKMTPVTINGTLRGPERDMYRFYGKAGERRVFEVEARRIGSAIDPVLRLYDPSGKQIERSDDSPGIGVDARIDVALPREGEYVVEVHDSKFSDQAANHYRLKAGAFTYATGIFPLGWKRGGAVDVEFFGGNLPAPVKIKPAWDSVKKDDRFTMARLPGSDGALPFVFAVSDYDEMLEPAGNGPHKIPDSVVVNGRIAKPGEVDRYTVAAKPGDHYVFDLTARDLGTSRLVGVITVYDDKGKKLASAGDIPPGQDAFAVSVAGEVTTDPTLSLRVPENVNSLTVAVEDLAQNGGLDYAYRLLVRRQPPDFELTMSTPYVNIPASGTVIVNVSALRRGYMGDIQLSIPDVPDDLIVAGGHIPAEIPDIDNRTVSRRGVLTITAKPGAKPRSMELSVWGEGSFDGEAIRRRAGGLGMITAVRGNTGLVDPNRRGQNRPFVAPWLCAELPAMIGPEPAGHIEVEGPHRLRLIQGKAYDFKWSFNSRNPAVKAPDTVSTDTPGARELRVLGNRKSAKGAAGAGEFTMATTIGTPPSTFDVIMSGRAGDETVYAPAVTVEVVQGYFVAPPSQAGPLAPGGKMDLVGTARREEGFTSTITITPDGLPLHVTCPPGEAQGLEYKLSCEADPQAAPGEYKFLLHAASILAGGEEGKVPYRIAPVEAKIIVGKP